MPTVHGRWSATLATPASALNSSTGSTSRAAAWAPCARCTSRAASRCRERLEEYSDEDRHYVYRVVDPGPLDFTHYLAHGERAAGRTARMHPHVDHDGHRRRRPLRRDAAAARRQHPDACSRPCAASSGSPKPLEAARPRRARSSPARRLQPSADGPCSRAAPSRARRARCGPRPIACAARRAACDTGSSASSAVSKASMRRRCSGSATGSAPAITTTSSPRATSASACARVDQLGERAAIDGLEALREFARHGRRALGAERCGARLEHRDDPVRRLVEDERARLVRERLERGAARSGLGRQEAFEAEALRR